MDIDHQTSPTSRMIWLDLWKGLLVFVMIMAHCIQFFGDEHALIQGAISKFANITTFSAFFFVFGVTSAVSSLRKTAKQSVPKLAKNFWRYLFAYYVSAFAYGIFVEDHLFLPSTIHKILGLRVLMGYSEFLLAFAVMELLMLLLFPLWQRMKQRDYILFGIFSLISCLYPYRQNKEPIIGLFTGSEQFYSFPILPYILYFVLGLWYYNYVRTFSLKKKWLIAIASVLASIPAFYHILKYQEIPERFPPGLVFILGAAFSIPLYISLCKRLEKWGRTSNILRQVIMPLQIMGENSLLFLILSNLVMFALKGTAFYRQSIGFTVTAFVIILYLCFFTVRISSKRVVTKSNTETGTSFQRLKQ